MIAPAKASLGSAAPCEIFPVLVQSRKGPRRPELHLGYAGEPAEQRCL